MRIKAIKVDRYGPMREFSATGLGGFTLIRGSNEQGKTLLIDALLRLLFRKKFGRNKNFGNMSRVEEPPEGYVVLELGGEEVKIDRSDSLAKRVPITTTDFRNTFVVRDSDLTIVDKGAYFTDVSEKLAGLRTSEINRIKKTLQDKGRLTNPGSTADLANSADADHIRGKVDKARAFVDEIKALADRLDESDFERLEQVLAERRDRLARERRELELLGNAKARAECLEARGHLESLKRIHRELEELDTVNERDLEVWAHGARDLKRMREDLDDIRREHERHQTQLTELEDAHSKMRAGDESIRERWRRVKDLLEPRIIEYKNHVEAHSGEAGKTTVLCWSAVISAIGLLLSLGGAVLRPALYFFVSGAVFFVAVAVASVWLFRLRSGEAKTARLFAGLKTQAARLGLEGSSSDDVQRVIGDVERACDDSRRVVDAARVRLEAHKKHMETAERRMRDLRGDIDDVERKIASMKITSGVSTLADYQARLRVKTDHHGHKRTLEAMLDRSLGSGGNEDPVALWEAKLDRQASELDGVTWVAYDAPREAALRDSQVELESAIKKTEEALKAGRQMLRDLESKVRNSGVTDPENIVCRTSGELRRLGEQLDEFVCSVLQHRDDARAALRILEDIEAEEKTRVIELFGADKSVSAYFKRVSGGRYIEVRFDPEAVELSVRRDSGEWLTAHALSGGARDQLYLAIRLSIAESMLGDERGFFVLDDPFVKSDTGRLRNQLQLLQTVVASGWQVLYFTAKSEVHGLLARDIAASRVHLIDLDAVVSPEEPVPAVQPAPANDLFSDGPTY